MSIKYVFNPTTGNLDATDKVAFNGEVTAGSAASPSIFFTGTTTGLYSPGAGQVAISTNGTGKLFVTSAGSIGVGTSNPNKVGASRAITVNGTDVAIELSTGDSLKTLFYTNGTDTVLSNSVAGALRFSTDSAERLRITSTGALNFVGAGTAGSTQAVSFNGSAPVDSLVIDSTGKVGLGTSSPEGALHINGTGGTSNTTAQLRFSLGGTTEGIFGVATAANNVISGSAQGDTVIRNDGGNINFSVDSGTSTHMRLDSSGQLGVGTTPSYTLDVAGTINSRSANAAAFDALQFYGTAMGANNKFWRTQITPTDQNWQTVDDAYTTANTWLKATRNGNQVETISFLTGTSGTSERARIDSSGRLLVGTSSGSGNAKIQLEGGTLYGDAYLDLCFKGTFASGQTLGELRFTDAAASANVYAKISANADGTPGSGDYPGRLVFSTTADGASSPTERMIIKNNGNILVGSNSDAGFTFQVSKASGAAGYFNRNTDDGAVVGFGRQASLVGTISVTTTATAYNTSSDYRLKENVTAVTDGITRLQQLKPSRFNFIADPDTTVDGFLAHEVQTVVPEAITGEKDAVDDEGNPQYQGIDQSKLVPLLTAALQEAIGEIESLKARVAALESA